MEEDLIGESGEQRIDGEYLLGSKQKGEMVTIAPGLEFRLLDQENSLRLGNLERWKGFVSVTFAIPGRNFTITLTDHDLSPNSITHGDGITGPQWYSFSDNNYSYRIIGTSSRILNHTQVYLNFRVTRTRISEQNDK